jgi:metal-dependent amidase/aminoacylase/carboxypeptidase family protein
MEGTVRSFAPKVREVLLVELKQACETAPRLGGKYELDIVPHVPSPINDPDLTVLVQQVGRELLGDGNACPARPEMGGENFAFYLEHAPGVYSRLGVATPGQPLRHAHSPTFDLDERALPIGAAMLAETVQRWLVSASVSVNQKAQPWHNPAMGTTSRGERWMGVVAP